MEGNGVCHFLDNRNYVTEQILPWRPADSINLVWPKGEYNAHLMRITPALAPSRLITQRKHARGNPPRRVGIAFEYEHNFMWRPHHGPLLSSEV